MASQHATLIIKSDRPIFPVILQNVDLGIRLQSLRFFLTREAVQFLELVKPGICAGLNGFEFSGPSELNYCLCGQSVLMQVITVQVLNHGVLFLPLSFCDELVKKTAVLHDEAVSSESFEGLKDLREQRDVVDDSQIQQDESFSVLNEYSAEVSRLGRRIDDFGPLFR